MFIIVCDFIDRYKKVVDKVVEVIYDMGVRVYVIVFEKDVDDLSLKKLVDF